MDKKRITFYVMKRIKDEVAEDAKYRLKAKGLGEILLSMAKYYAYVDSTIDDLERKMINTMYEGPVTLGNKKAYKLRVDYTEVDINVFTKLALEWNVDSISKVANFILYKSLYLDLEVYQRMLTQGQIATPGYDTWIYTESILIKDLDLIELYNKLLREKKENTPVLQLKNVPQNVYDSLDRFTTKEFYEEVIREGLKAINER